MAYAETSRQGLAPSLLDRLIDPSSGGQVDGHFGYTLEAVQEAVRRDLEDLLNTQRSSVAVPASCVETKNSVFDFGVPDVTSISGVGAKLRESIGRAIEEAVARHEPRLKDIRAIPIEGDEKDLRLKLQISARLRVDPYPDVAFVTILKLTTGQATVAPGSG
jgi:type VI secretion system protein ImpF